MLNHEYLKPANFLSPKLASTLQRNINLNAILPIFQPPRPFHHLVCRLFIQQPSGPAAAWGQANWALGCHGLSQNGTYDEQNAQFKKHLESFSRLFFPKILLAIFFSMERDIPYRDTPRTFRFIHFNSK